MNTKSKKIESGEAQCNGMLRVHLYDSGGNKIPIKGASIEVLEWKSNEWQHIETRTTDENGYAVFELLGGDSHRYGLVYKNAFGFHEEPAAYSGDEPQKLFSIDCNCTKQIGLGVPVNFTQQLVMCGPRSEELLCQDIVAGQPAKLRISHSVALGNPDIRLSSNQGGLSQPSIFVDGIDRVYEIAVDTTGMQGGYFFNTFLKHPDGSSIATNLTGTAVRNIQHVDARTTTSLTRTETSFTEDTAFWTGIRNSAEALSFNNYLSFMDWIFCGKQKPRELSQFESDRYDEKHVMWRDKLLKNRFLPFTDSDAYRVVKAATEAFVMVNCGVHHNDLQPFDPARDEAYLNRRDLPIPPSGLNRAFNKDYLVGIDGNGDVLPYLSVIRRKLPDIPIKIKPFEEAASKSREGVIDADECYGLLQEKLANPCLLELIWSYWHEEGMLVQTSNAITRRFQNVRSSSRDPLASMEMDPLRPLNNLLWGYIQDEQHRLTVNRRNYEYDHHYGLRLEGKAVQNFRPADTRSKFLEAFHHLLRLCTVFYKQDDDTTVKADAFPVLNALKEVHLILSQGAHNQFGDLPSTARIEMLMQQWILARPEFRELLPTRVMVAYPEPWMDRVDAMKKLQGWTDTSVLHFRNLGMFGEQLLLSIRWGHWSDEFEPVKALNWARFFRPQVQGYIHAYRATTGVDLSADPTVSARVDSTLPSALLQKRLASQQRTI
ncbi:hypothetical protein SAMN05216317_1126 [Nitrosomonas eutropha]|uniref:hypothetical protein n=1 Tax=Nitrosomonas TaxID=914 RepID=UPI0008822A40|nr:MULTISPECIES: hypothetical protein [Nitrosomonas]MXS80367.1 hypothetical protein [Nitrosomonas sp. GH22]SCW99615.1 hypothetical protein SAMN05216379_1014 [Nitrosomonas eutropha]SDW76162.1 hypothetical protein SAMN05216317_1126 [Nitrosomonas eutropha]